LAGRATEQLAGRAGGSLGWQVAHRRAVMVAKRRRRCPQEHGWGGPAGARWAWWPRRCGCRPCLRRRAGVLGQRPESTVWCGCPAARVPVHAAAVRCPVWVSGRPDVRCPVSSVGVRCPWVSASTVSGREVVERWRWAGSRMAGMAGVGVVACGVHGQFVVGLGRSLAVEPGAGRAGPAEGSAWTWPSSWAVVGSWLGRARGRPGLAGCAGGSSVGWRAGVPSEAATTLRGHRVRTRAEPPGRGEPSGLDCDLRVRPWCGRSLQ
jgi:hypothetical protein